MNLKLLVIIGLMNAIVDEFTDLGRCTPVYSLCIKNSMSAPRTIHSSLGPGLAS